MDFNIDEVLERAVSAGASDVHLKIGSATIIRIDGFEYFDQPTLRDMPKALLPRRLLPISRRVELLTSPMAGMKSADSEFRRFASAAPSRWSFVAWS